MSTTHLLSGCRPPARTRLAGSALLLVVLVILVTSVACSRGASPSSPAARYAALQQIAASYARDGDLARAQTALKDMNLANPGQLLVTQAEQAINEGKPQDQVSQLAALAGALGARSPKVVAYLAPAAAPTAPPPTAVQPVLISAPAAPAAATAALVLITATAPPSAEAPVQAGAPTVELTTAPTSQPAPAPTSAPARPRVTAPNAVNLRSGPGLGYPVMGQMQAGQTLDIMAKSPAGDWLRVAYPSEEQAWVSAGIVDVSGADAVAVAKNIPAAPPTAVPAPTQPSAPTQPPAPQATKTPEPPAGVTYVIKGFRLRPVGTDAQRCDGGDHNIWVIVEDAAGNRLDGVRVREIWTNTIRPTGSQGKGAGTALWDIYRGGGGQVDIVDEGNNRISELTPGMSDDWPDPALMWAAGYCGCRPYPDQASCTAALQAKQEFAGIGHFVYEVVFRRTY